ncbi:hypothetical protein BRC90_08245 [Halobacteriales archaeon QS_4_69_34]|nr:MAG: hypothetical protein BRC90_08245 [Halobacteriales archaeon QS_4_69_34]
MRTLAPTEPYTTRFEATVASVADGEVVLDETYFYAESGGQPADRGTLADREVRDVYEREGAVVHALADPPDVEAGETVLGEIDAAFRTYCMRAHTASHALYGAGRRLFEGPGYGGFDIGEATVRIDFATPTAIDDATVVALERLVNRAVWDSHEVSWAELPREEALAREDVAFNVETEEGLAGERVRLVEIDGWDRAACGGTHVRNTREIGPVSVLGRSNPGEGLTRVEFAVGPAAIQRRAEEQAAALDAAAALETSVRELPEAVARLRHERDALAADRADLQEQIVDARLDDLLADTITKDGRKWLVGAVDHLDANELAERARALAGDAAGVVALVDTDGAYLAVATADGVDASAVVEAVTAVFGGGGGGSERVAQGGGIEADAAAVVAFLRGDGVLE